MIMYDALYKEKPFACLCVICHCITKKKYVPTYNEGHVGIQIKTAFKRDQYRPGYSPLVSNASRE